MKKNKAMAFSGNSDQITLFDTPILSFMDKDSSKGDKTNKYRGSANPKLQIVERLNKDYEMKWAERLGVDNNLTRSLVSFQANKGRAVYRWFKYKEAFSAGLVEYLLNKQKISGGTLLDPFAGVGTALFAASRHGMKAEGIELLPIGQTIIETRKVIESDLKPYDIKQLEFWRDVRPWSSAKTKRKINELRITKGAYPLETIEQMGSFLAALEEENEPVKATLFFAFLCILESVSYTRKDGQYLRWDYRAGRCKVKKIFDKGEILPFDQAMTEKLNEIISDLRAVDIPDDLFAATRLKGEVILHPGSCLSLLPNLKTKSFDCIITSPPYCNRYDYTRTYALELALLGIDEKGLAKLRQEMLSCTVENRTKDILSHNPKWKLPVSVADNQELLQVVLSYLNEQKDLGLLNNNGIPRMVRGYFYEMACVIYECSRIMKSGALFIMVNDNVRYSGASIPVDIILSE
ncbi:site-specific DNA-methyltransferase, partial [Candidatus Sumerlaeota bacterium]|nr:site-specific DNA-methyltransferase [Candidatus Sumerlaeota bacterium]